jgi:hypothetical protein
MILKNNDTRVEKPYDTRICRNVIITWATLLLGSKEERKEKGSND